MSDFRPLSADFSVAPQISIEDVAEAKAQGFAMIVNNRPAVWGDAALGLVRAQRPAARRAWMLLSVVVNLGMLAWFKYGNFLLANFNALVAPLGVQWQAPHYDIVLPVGISFYTFATLSYTLDVYLRRATPARNFLDYALFVTFFPHLVAGPIMRPTELVPQFEQPRRATAQMLRFGLALMTLGLFQKVVLADALLAPAAEMVYDGMGAPGALDAWLGTLAFSGQIFCDFAGYSTTAIGANTVSMAAAAVHLSARIFDSAQ